MEYFHPESYLLQWYVSMLGTVRNFVVTLLLAMGNWIWRYYWVVYCELTPFWPWPCLCTITSTNNCNKFIQRSGQRSSVAFWLASLASITKLSPLVFSPASGNAENLSQYNLVHWTIHKTQLLLIIEIRHVLKLCTCVQIWVNFERQHHVYVLHWSFFFDRTLNTVSALWLHFCTELNEDAFVCVP